MRGRILIVDDEMAVLFALQDYFTQHGYDVDCVSDSSEAKALLATASYAAVISDLCLKGAGDTEGLEIIRHAAAHHPRIATILLTAHGSREIEARMKALGGDVMLDKPVALPRLEQVLATVMAGVS